MRIRPHRYQTTREEDQEEMESNLANYTHVRGWMYAHAIGKLSSTERQRLFLLRKSVYCNCDGGIAMNDRDLQKLIRKGLMCFKREGRHPKRYTVAVITEKGQRARI